MFRFGGTRWRSWLRHCGALEEYHIIKIGNLDQWSGELDGVGSG